MEETTEYISQRTKEIVLTSRPGPGCPIPLIPQIQYRVKQKRRQLQQAKVLTPMLLPMPDEKLRFHVMLKVVSLDSSAHYYARSLYFHRALPQPATRSTFPTSIPLFVIQLL
jgi:hypothetical protein